MIQQMVTETRSPEETYALGEKIGKAAQPGQIYTLTGDLGVGKTVFYTGGGSGTWYYRTGKQPDIYNCTGV